MNRRIAIKNTALFFGYAVTVGALTDTFIACRNETRNVTLDWKPEFLTANQANTLAEMTETILPRTKTPGAKDIGVPQFIESCHKVFLVGFGKEFFQNFVNKLRNADVLRARCFGARKNCFGHFC